MDAKTLEALKGSIKHWRKNVEAKTAAETSTYSTDCPLCSLFNTGISDNL